MFVSLRLSYPYLPNGTDVKHVNGGGTGKPPFRDNLDYLDRQITLPGTGGRLTVLTEGGSGTSILKPFPTCSRDGFSETTAYLFFFFSCLASFFSFGVLDGFFLGSLF